MENVWGTMLGLACMGVFVLAFAAAGVFLIYRSIRSRKQADASQSWPEVEGQITATRIVHSRHEDSDGDTHDSYSPRVEYTYQVGGQTYTGQRISFGFNPSFSNPNKAQSFLGRYPVGGAVRVYHDPNLPGEAVLEKRSSGSTTGMVLGIIFLGISACLVCPALFVLSTRTLNTLGGGNLP